MGDAAYSTEFESFLLGCKFIVEDEIGSRIWKIDRGPRYIRISHARPGNSGGSVFCFVNRENGDVLKAAGWKAPAKHARGNIYDDKNGLGSITWTGPAYLR